MKNILFLFLFTSQFLFSQTKESDLFGLWEVAEVSAGERKMTPFSKWVEFKPDHTHRGGNGWVQHSVGTWELNLENATLKIITTNGTEDPYGPFKISIENNEMTWKRTEEGMTVNVSLKRINEIPATYFDKMIGLWQVESMESNKVNAIFNKSSKLFIRWTRNYSITHSDKWNNGVWQAHAHLQEVRFLSNDGDDCDTRWEVSFKDEKMILQRIGAPKSPVTFKRVHRF